MSTENARSLCALPDDVVLVILNRVGDVKSLGACAASCRRLRACVPRVSTAVVSVDSLLKARAADTTGPASSSASSSASSPSASGFGKSKAMTQLRSTLSNLLRSFQREDEEASSGGSDSPPPLAQAGRGGRGDRSGRAGGQRAQQQQRQCFDVEDVVRSFPLLQELLIVLPDCEFTLDREAALRWYADFDETLSSCAIVAADSISLLAPLTPPTPPTPSRVPSPASSLPHLLPTPPPPAPPPPPPPPPPPSSPPSPPPPISLPPHNASLSPHLPSRASPLPRSSSSSSPSQPPLWAPLWGWVSAAGSSHRQAATTHALHTGGDSTLSPGSSIPSSSQPSQPSLPSHPSELYSGNSVSPSCQENAQGSARGNAVPAGKWTADREQRGGGDRGKGRDKGKGKVKEKVEPGRISVETGGRGDGGGQSVPGGCIVARLGFSRVVDITDSSQVPNRTEGPANRMPPPVPARSLASMSRLLAASRSRGFLSGNAASGSGGGSGGGSGTGSGSSRDSSTNGNRPSQARASSASSSASSINAAVSTQSSGIAAAGDAVRSRISDRSGLSSSNCASPNSPVSGNGNGRGSVSTACTNSSYSDHSRPSDLIESLRRSTSASERASGCSSGGNTSSGGRCNHENALANDCSKGSGAHHSSRRVFPGQTACDTSLRSSANGSGSSSSRSSSERSTNNNHGPPSLLQVHAAASTPPGPSWPQLPLTHSAPSLPSASVRYSAPTSPTSSCFPTPSNRLRPFRPPPIRLTPNGLKERIAWTISAAVAASARHELLRRIARQLPELKQVAIADVQGQGSLSLGPEQLACLRRVEEDKASADPNSYAPRTPLPTLKMLLWHAPSLTVGDMELTGATLVILRNEKFKVAKAGDLGSQDGGISGGPHTSQQEQLSGFEGRGEIAERSDAEHCLRSLLAPSDPLLHASLELLQLSQTQRFEFSAF
ncbi:hypothetical protein CLOM_g6217 [Closterium sp. NIES-68]|nr:hypothetical protein CLOM_g6217 [Closterium sp. NIES-68]GJP62067.1 hypothetical protein CLOP_g19168 [Closterium sp. NIES-67]